MKDIDFLPEWYKSGRRRQESYRTQYVVLGAVFFIMITWNLIAGSSVSRSMAELSADKTEEKQAEYISGKFSKLRNELREFEEKAGVDEKIDSRIDVAGVLAELSYLISDRVVLSSVDFAADEFSNQQQSRSGAALPVRAAGSNSTGRARLFIGDVRFRIVINGLAADGSDVAELICELESSPYFTHVMPLFSRGTELRRPDVSSRQNIEVTEFEISCYLANYVTVAGEK